MGKHLETLKKQPPPCRATMRNDAGLTALVGLSLCLVLWCGSSCQSPVPGTGAGLSFKVESGPQQTARLSISSLLGDGRSGPAYELTPGACCETFVFPTTLDLPIPRESGALQFVVRALDAAGNELGADMSDCAARTARRTTYLRHPVGCRHVSAHGFKLLDFQRAAGMQHPVGSRKPRGGGDLSDEDGGVGPAGNAGEPPNMEGDQTGGSMGNTAGRGFDVGPQSGVGGGFQGGDRGPGAATGGTAGGNGAGTTDVTGGTTGGTAPPPDQQTAGGEPPLGGTGGRDCPPRWDGTGDATSLAGAAGTETGAGASAGQNMPVAGQTSDPPSPTNPDFAPVPPGFEVVLEWDLIKTPFPPQNGTISGGVFDNGWAVTGPRDQVVVDLDRFIDDGILDVQIDLAFPLVREPENINWVGLHQNPILTQQTSNDTERDIFYLRTTCLKETGLPPRASSFRTSAPRSGTSASASTKIGTTPRTFP